MDGAHDVRVSDVRDRAPGFTVHRHTARLNLGAHAAIEDDQPPGPEAPTEVVSRTLADGTLHVADPTRRQPR